jgi:hypothetical protein
MIRSRLLRPRAPRTTHKPTPKSPSSPTARQTDVAPERSRASSSGVCAAADPTATAAADQAPSCVETGIPAIRGASVSTIGGRRHDLTACDPCALSGAIASPPDRRADSRGRDPTEASAMSRSEVLPSTLGRELDVARSVTPRSRLTRSGSAGSANRSVPTGAPGAALGAADTAGSAKVGGDDAACAGWTGSMGGAGVGAVVGEGASAGGGAAAEATGGAVVGLGAGAVAGGEVGGADGGGACVPRVGSRLRGST